jgi:hypothetical protein
MNYLKQRKSIENPHSQLYNYSIMVSALEYKVAIMSADLPWFLIPIVFDPNWINSYDIIVPVVIISLTG